MHGGGEEPSGTWADEAVGAAFGRLVLRETQSMPWESRVARACELVVQGFELSADADWPLEFHLAMSQGCDLAKAHPCEEANTALELCDGAVAAAVARASHEKAERQALEDRRATPLFSPPPTPSFPCLALLPSPSIASWFRSRQRRNSGRHGADMASSAWHRKALTPPGQPRTLPRRRN